MDRDNRTTLTPHLLARGTRRDVSSPSVRVVMFAPNDQRASWIESELNCATIVTQIARTVEQIVCALIEDPTPRPQVLVVDLDAVTPGDLLYLHLVRERGWCGRIIGLGIVPPALRASLGIERVLNTPFVRDSLADAIQEIGFHATTKKIPVFDDSALEAATLPQITPLMRPRIMRMAEPTFTARSPARVIRTPLK